MNKSESIKSKRTIQLSMQRYAIGFILFAMIIGMSLVSPVFRTSGNAINILLQVSSNGILAIGMLFVMVTGGIDLSIGSSIALTSVVLGKMLTDITPGNLWLGIGVAIAVPVIFGAMNGFMISKFNMFPFVVTLATQLVIRGAAYLVGQGASVTLVSPKLRAIGTGRLFGTIPYPVIIFLIIAAIAYVLLHKTRFGRYVYAVGGNRLSAASSGIDVFKVQMAAYIIMGVCAGIAGIITTSRISAAQPNIGIGYETDAIAACVIGGTSFSGGIGKVSGTMIGILMIGVIYNSMNLLQISSYWQTVTKGVLILVAVLLDLLVNKK